VATVEETKETKTEGQVMDNVTVGLTPAQQVGVRRIADEVFIFSKIGKLPITPAVREQLVAEFGNSVLRYEQRIGTSAAAADFIDVGADITERDAIIGSITELTARLLLNPVDADIQLAKSMLNPGKIGEQAAAGAAGISSEIPGEAPKAEAAKKKSIKDRLLFWKQTEKPTTTTLSEQMAFISGLAGLMDTSAFNPEPTVTAAAA
jgi:hypothetical protein